jgi:hypothetical protein
VHRRQAHRSHYPVCCRHKHISKAAARTMGRTTCSLDALLNLRTLIVAEGDVFAFICKPRLTVTVTSSFCQQLCVHFETSTLKQRCSTETPRGIHWFAHENLSVGFASPCVVSQHLTTVQFAHARQLFVSLKCVRDNKQVHNNRLQSIVNRTKCGQYRSRSHQGRLNELTCIYYKS